MDDLREEISAELENVNQVVEELAKIKDLSMVSSLELAGVATLLHNFYNGAENVLKRVVLDRGKSVSQGMGWHRELLNTASESGIISESMKDALGRYLAFRHFFVHGYALDLRVNRMAPLVKNVSSVYRQFSEEIGFPLT